MFNGIFGNWKTSLFGAITGAATYLLISGVTLPTKKEDWGAFVLGLLQAIWGAMQKDSSTGSKAA